jgi:hypothetical protein
VRAEAVVIGCDLSPDRAVGVDPGGYKAAGQAAQFGEQHGRPTMRKAPFTLGVALGFVLGSRAGHGPYNELASQARRLRARPEVQGAVDRTKDQVNHLITDKLPSPVAAVLHAGNGHSPHYGVTGPPGFESLGEADIPVEGRLPDD